MYRVTSKYNVHCTCACALFERLTSVREGV